MFIMQDQDREPLEDIKSFGTEKRIVESTSQVHVTIFAELHRALFPLGIKLDVGRDNGRRSAILRYRRESAL